MNWFPGKWWKLWTLINWSQHQHPIVKMNENQNIKLKYHLNHLYIFFLYFICTQCPLLVGCFLFFFVFLTAAPEKSVDQSNPPIDSWTCPSSSELRVVAVLLACLLAAIWDDMPTASLVLALWALHAKKSHECTQSHLTPLSMSSVRWVCLSLTWHRPQVQSYSSPGLISSCPTCLRASRRSTRPHHRWRPGRLPGRTWRW